MNRIVYSLVCALIVLSSASIYAQTKPADVPVIFPEDDALARKLTDYETRLNTAWERRDIATIQGIAKELEANYGREDVWLYSELMKQIIGQLCSHGDQSEFKLAQEYALRALEKGDGIPILQTLGIVQYLGVYVPTKTPEEAAELRTKKTNIWLQAWSRMNAAIDRKFDFTKEPWLNISPPLASEMPAGVAPDSIKDPILRAQYEADIAANSAYAKLFGFQYQLKNAEETFDKQLKGYLIYEYSLPGANFDELNAVIAKYGLEDKIATKVRGAVDRARAGLPPVAEPDRPSTRR